MKSVVLFLGLMIVAGAAPVLAADSAPAASSAVNLDQLRSGLVGTWQNIADPGFTRELKPDGTATERYEGDESATSTGRWLLFSGSVPPAELVSRKLPADGVYLEVSTRGDTYLFALTALDPQSFQLLNLDRKQSLVFSRLK